MTGPTGGTPRLRIEADLAVEIDGVPAHICGDGEVVQVMTERPIALMRSASKTSLPVVVRDSMPAWRDQLAAGGLRVEVRSPRGLLASFGESASGQSASGQSASGQSWVPRLAPRHITPGSSQVLVREVAHEAAQALPQQRVLLVILAAVLAPLGVRILRRVLRSRS